MQLLWMDLGGPRLLAICHCCAAICSLQVRICAGLALTQLRISLRVCNLSYQHSIIDCSFGHGTFLAA